MRESGAAGGESTTAAPVRLAPPATEGAAEALRERALHVLRTQRVGVMVVAYDAERHIERLLERIPADVAALLAEIFVLDDCSRDRTAEVAAAAGRKLGLERLRVFRTPQNRGYGGNQKVGYTYAIETGLDIVIMLHGDGQYPPEHLTDLIAAFAEPDVDVVLGSRMINRRDALRGGMPIYKWVGNQVLTRFENAMLGVALAEFHTGFRGYRVARLRAIPFRYGSDGFHFDTEILIQFISAGCRIAEVPIPTHYGDEVCHVNGMRYAWDCAKDVVLYRAFRMGFFYNPLLDFDLFENETYHFKKEANSLHQTVLRLDWPADQSVLEIGAAAGYLSAALAERAGSVTALDRERPRHAGRAETMAVDLDGDFAAPFAGRQFDTVVALDVMEHLASPEQAAMSIARLLRPGGRVLASTANISFFLMRLMLLFGIFNYGKRGILDHTHRRLFTISSFRHLFRTYGFEIVSVRGFGPPIRDMISRRFPFSLCDSLLAGLARIAPRLFAYNFLIVARRLPSLEEVYAATVANGLATAPAPGEPESVLAAAAVAAAPGRGPSA